MQINDPQCKECHTSESHIWWRCCEEHMTSEFDLLCDTCNRKLHPICGVVETGYSGQQYQCGMLAPCRTHKRRCQTIIGMSNGDHAQCIADEGVCKEPTDHRFRVEDPDRVRRPNRRR